MHWQYLRPGKGFFLLSLGIAAGIGLFAFDVRANAPALGGNAAWTTDYVWRGTSQTRGDPAVQAGMKFMSETGLYGSVWGSNIEFAPETHASSEFDFTLGWSGDVFDYWVLDANILHYRYPSTAVDLNWTELNGTLIWKNNYWLSLGWSPEALGSNDSGLYTQVGAKFPFGERFRLETVIGYYDLDRVDDDSYLHGQLSAVWAIKAPLEVRMTAHVTDSSAKDIFGEDAAGNRVEAALQASF